MSGYWYCTECKEEVDPSGVTFSEQHGTCGMPVHWVETTQVVVPLTLIKEVGNIGVDFGYGKYELAQNSINLARKIVREAEKE